MIFQNTSDHKVIVCIDSKKIQLEPNERIELYCSDRITVKLSHSYSSSAMSEKEIALDDQDVSLVSLLTLSYKKPYFDIVLDSTYEMICKPDSTVYICQEKIRPSYACSYDRLYPFVEDGIVKDILYDFPEKKSYEKHYTQAVTASNRKIITILLTVLSILCLPIALICFLVNWKIGIVITLIMCLILLFIRFLGILFSKLTCAADCFLVLSDFESDKIMNYFKNTEADKENR